MISMGMTQQDVIASKSFDFSGASGLLSKKGSMMMLIPLLHTI
jgi:hypothetical protein